MVTTITFSNLYPGLAEGPIQPEAKVINAINNGILAFIGHAVHVDTIAEGSELGSLPRVSASTITGGPTIGIEVGGVLKGVYGDSRNFTNISAELRLDPALIALQGDAVRVCTEGVCIATLITRESSGIKIGDPLTADFFIDSPFLSFGPIRKANSGEFVIARALQPVPGGTTENAQGRYGAVNVQREGKLP